LNIQEKLHFQTKLIRKELETKLKEARKRKKEKFQAKMKALEEAKEKDKNRWQSFNQKVIHFPLVELNFFQKLLF
jgi:hypothetical protein